MARKAVEALRPALALATAVTAFVLWRGARHSPDASALAWLSAGTFSSVFAVIYIGRLAGLKTSSEAEPTDLTASPRGKVMVGVFLILVFALVGWAVFRA